ncbi:MAG: hypothetical protein ACFCUO_10835 [Rhodospirillales bacterium]
MFGLGVTKILFTLVVVVVVWYGWRWLGRVQARRRVEREAAMRSEVGREPPGRGNGRAAAAAAEDLVRCETCGAYVAARRARHCGRTGCPYMG